MQPPKQVSTPEREDIKELKGFVRMLKRIDAKKYHKLETILSNDDVKTSDLINIIYGVEGGKAGEKWPLTRESHEAFVRVLQVLDTVLNDWMNGNKEISEYQTILRFRRKIIGEYVMRCHTGEYVSKPISDALKAFVEYTEGELPETYQEVEKG